jgi:hypothetical protein
MKKIFAAVLLLSAALLSAQTAAELEDLLNTKEITWAEAAYFTLASSAEAVPGNGQKAARQIAFQFVREQGWLPENAEAEGPVKLRNLSLLMMKAFDIEGGLMYRLFPGPRYAYREMTRRGFIKGVALLGFNTPPLGALLTGGAGDLFPRIRKDFKEKSSISQGLPCGCSFPLPCRPREKCCGPNLQVSPFWKPLIPSGFTQNVPRMFPGPITSEPIR